MVTGVCAVRILVTGATGFIGRHLVTNLADAGHQVSGIARDVTRNRIPDPRIEYTGVDCLSLSAIRHYLASRQFDTTIHMACILPQDGIPQDSSILLDNIAMTLNLLRASTMRNIPRFVYVSSTAVYGSPQWRDLPVTPSTLPNLDSFYAVSKYAGEKLTAREYQEASCMILRLSSPYGYGMKETVLSRFVRRALAGEPLDVFGDGQRSQDFTYIKDIVDGIACAVAGSCTGVANISSGVGTTMLQLARMVVELTGSASQVQVGSKPDAQSNYRMIVSHRSATELIGYKPRYFLKNGLAEYICALDRDTAKKDTANGR